MQFQVSGGTRSALCSALVVCGLIAAGFDPALASTPAKKHPKGFVHDTAGDGQQAPAPSNTKTVHALPKWQQYDAGGLYYYQHNEIEKARAYWIEALRLAEVDVPAERIKGLTAPTADACCKLIKHLTYFVSDAKFKPNYDASYGSALGTTRRDSGQHGQNPLQYSLDRIKDSLREMDKDWEWYERVCNFADRAIGKQRDCMRGIYSQREIFERKIVMTRQNGLQIEQQMGVPFKNSAIDTRPLKWDGVEGAGNPFSKPGANPTPLKYRGGAPPGAFDDH